jgi:uncharacterized membrane protein YccC
MTGMRLRPHLGKIVGTALGFIGGLSIAPTFMPDGDTDLTAVFWPYVGLTIGWWVDLFRAASKK